MYPRAHMPRRTRSHVCQCHILFCRNRRVMHRGSAVRQGLCNTPSMGYIRIGPAVSEQAIICIPFPRTA